jgi:FdhE protein
MSDAAIADRSLSGDVERLRRERPFVRPFVDPFLGLLLARRPLVAELAAQSARQPIPMPDPTRLGLGACLEARDAFPLEPEGLNLVFSALHQVLVDGFRDARIDLLCLGRATAGDANFLPQVARSMVGDRHDELLRMAHGLGVEAQILGFWIIQMLTPLAMARGRLLREAVPDEVWNRGYCPVCGSWPGLARQRGADREMTCSFCATTWLFRRQECPFCEAPGPSGQGYAVPGFEQERVLTCRRCNHYLAEISEESLAGLDSEVAALALAPLELLARQNGHSPATMDWRQMVWVR